MTQQPYYPQQGYQPQPAPQQFQQPYPGQAPAPYPQQGFPPQQQAYGQPGQVPPGQPQVPLASGSLDDFFNQPSAGGGPSITWSVNGMPKPEGTTYTGIVARDVQASDIQQQTDPKSGQPKFYRDGSPQFVMKVPLKLQPSQEFPDGEGVLFVRGQMRDELVRAMTESGAARDPKGGDAVQVTLVQRKPSRGGGMPMNVFAVRYQPANPGQGQPATSGAPSPAPEVAPQAQPVQQQFAPIQQQPQQVAQPQQFQQPAQQQPQGVDFSQLGQQAQPVQQQAPQQQAPFAPQFQAPAQPQGQQFQPAQPQQVQQGAPQPPANLDAEQAALIAQLTNRQPA